jgi:hypothetical protein
MSLIAHTWTILHRTDLGHAHDSLLPENAPVPEGDEQFRVIPVVPADHLAGAVEALEAAREFAGNFIRYVADDEHLLAEQAWDVVRKINTALGGQ